LLYEIHHIGGPANGQMAIRFRPYFRMKHADNVAGPGDASAPLEIPQHLL
jgi:hypothetical protein